MYAMVVFSRLVYVKTTAILLPGAFHMYPGGDIDIYEHVKGDTV